MKTNILALVIFGLFGSGCGGGGALAPAGPSGSYSGTWTSNSGDHGTALLNVGGGSVTGTVVDESVHETGTFSGTIASGVVFASVEYPHADAYTLSGSLNQVGGELEGTLVGSTSPVSVNMVLTLARA